jgi:hypothetical protein
MTFFVEAVIKDCLFLFLLSFLKTQIMVGPGLGGTGGNTGTAIGQVYFG